MFFPFLSFGFHLIQFYLSRNHCLAEVSKDSLIHYFEGYYVLHIHKVFESKLLKLDHFLSACSVEDDISIFSLVSEFLFTFKGKKIYSTHSRRKALWISTFYDQLLGHHQGP